MQPFHFEHSQWGSYAKAHEDFRRTHEILTMHEATRDT